MKIYIVISMGYDDQVYDFYKTKSKANKRLKELNDQDANDELATLDAYISEYNFSANRTGLINAMTDGLALTNRDAIGEVEK